MAEVPAYAITSLSPTPLDWAEDRNVRGRRTRGSRVRVGNPEDKICWQDRISFSLNTIDFPSKMRAMQTRRCLTGERLTSEVNPKMIFSPPVLLKRGVCCDVSSQRPELKQRIKLTVTK